MANRYLIELANKLLLEADNNNLIKLIQSSIEQMDTEFFELLKLEAIRQNKLDAFKVIVQTHLELSGSQYTRHYELTMILAEAYQKNQLDKSIATYQNEITEDFVHTIIVSAEDSVDKANFLQIGLMLLRIAKTLIEQFSYHSLYPRCQLVLSSYYLTLGETTKAAEVIQQSKDADIPDSIKQALLVNEGLVYFRQGKVKQAIRFYQQHESDFQDHSIWLDAQSNLAMCYSEIGRFSKSLSSLEKLASECNLPADAIRLARIKGNIANLYSRLGLLSEEKKYLDESIQAAKSQPSYMFDWSTLLVSYVNFTLLYLKQNDMEQADFWFEEYKQAAKNTDIESQLVTYARLQCHLQYGKGNYKQALQVIANTKHQFSNRQDVEYLAFLSIAGTVEYRVGEYQNAISTLEDLLHRSLASHHHEFVHVAYGYLGLCEAQNDNYSLAFDWFDKMFSQDSQLRNNISTVQHQFTYSADKEKLHQEVVRLVAKKNKGVRLFNIVQKVKSQALGHELKINADWESICHSLPKNAVLLEYYIQGDQAFCMLAASQFETPVYVSLNIDLGSIYGIYDRYLKALSVAKYVKEHDPFDLREAYDQLVAPILPCLEKYNLLIIAASNYAHQLPFEIFPTSDGKYLIDRFAMSYVPVGGVFKTCQEYVFESKDCLLIGSSHKNDCKEVKHQFDAEVEAVAELLMSEPLLNHPNSLQSLLNHGLSKAIHIASHGTFNPTNPLKSGVLLKRNGKDELLAIDKWISQLESTELIFLSGCDTGKVGLLENEEILGPLSLFLTRKVGSLILSHWPVSGTDEIITAIVADFYRNWLVDGMDKAIALQQAVVKHKKHPNPYYWGGFFLSGGVSTVGAEII